MALLNYIIISKSIHMPRFMSPSAQWHYPYTDAHQAPQQFHSINNVSEISTVVPWGRSTYEYQLYTLTHHHHHTLLSLFIVHLTALVAAKCRQAVQCRAVDRWCPQISLRWYGVFFVDLICAPNNRSWFNLFMEWRAFHIWFDWIIKL